MNGYKTRDLKVNIAQLQLLFANSTNSINHHHRQHSSNNGLHLMTEYFDKHLAGIISAAWSLYRFKGEVIWTLGLLRSNQKTFNLTIMIEKEADWPDVFSVDEIAPSVDICVVDDLEMYGLTVYILQHYQFQKCEIRRNCLFFNRDTLFGYFELSP